MRFVRKFRRVAIAALLVLASLPIFSCGLHRNDRMHISDQKYAVAKRLYDRNTSLLLTEQDLEQRHWQRAEINEAVYRLKKQYRLE